ncbi:MAG: DUF4271 domain-containing protein [Bacteroidales bacterium]
MQGDTTLHNSIPDTNNNCFVFCKSCTSPNISKADLLQHQNDSLSYIYLFDYSIKKIQPLESRIEIATRQSMFTDHQLKSHNSKIFVRNEESNDWIVFLLLLCFSVLAWILIFSRKRVKQITKACYSNRTINQLFRDGDLFKERLAIPFTIIYFISFSLFIFQTSHYYLNLKQFGLYTFLFYIKMLAIITGLYFLKQLISKFIGIVFKNNTATYFYLLNGLIYNIVSGIILLPLLLFMIFSQGVISSFAINISVFLLIVLSVVRYFRYIIIGVSYSKFSHFYFFLYLCTLEILPILIIIKIIIGMIDSKLKFF